MSWELNETSNKSGTNSKYGKLLAGESVTGFLMGKPRKFYKIFGKKEEVGEGTAGANLQFEINVVSLQNGAYIPKIYTWGRAVFKRIKELSENGYVIEKTLIKVSRAGSTKEDTVYSVVPLPMTMTDELWEQLRNVKLYDLSK